MEDDFEIAITNGKGTLIYNKAKIEAGESGYFSVGTLTIDLTAKRKGTGDKIIDHREHIRRRCKGSFHIEFRCGAHGRDRSGSERDNFGLYLEQQGGAYNSPGRRRDSGRNLIRRTNTCLR